MTKSYGGPEILAMMGGAVSLTPPPEVLDRLQSAAIPGLHGDFTQASGFTAPSVPGREWSAVVGGYQP
jgi:hypothetical protein